MVAHSEWGTAAQLPAESGGGDDRRQRSDGRICAVRHMGHQQLQQCCSYHRATVHSCPLQHPYEPYLPCPLIHRGLCWLFPISSLTFSPHACEKLHDRGIWGRQEPCLVTASSGHVTVTLCPTSPQSCTLQQQKFWWGSLQGERHSGNNPWHMAGHKGDCPRHPAQGHRLLERWLLCPCLAQCAHSSHHST